MNDKGFPKWLTLPIIVIALFLSIVGYQQITTKPSTITVTGNGKVSVKPGKVSLIVSKVSVNADVSAAIDDNEANMAQLITLAKRVGGNQAEINKSIYQITPQSNQFIVANALSLKTTNVANLNLIIKQFYQANATSVSNVSYLPEDETITEQAARKDAVANAATNAADIAKSVGKRLGKVVSIADDQAGTASTISNASVNDNSTITVTKSVQVAYEIW